MLAGRIRSLEEGPAGGNNGIVTSARQPLCQPHLPALPPAPAVPVSNSTEVASIVGRSNSGSKPLVTIQEVGGLPPAHASQGAAPGDSSRNALDRAVRLVNRMLSGIKVWRGMPVCIESMPFFFLMPPSYLFFMPGSAHAF